MAERLKSESMTENDGLLPGAEFRFRQSGRWYSTAEEVSRVK
jgi:hypothetical protein